MPKPDKIRSIHSSREQIDAINKDLLTLNMELLEIKHEIYKINNKLEDTQLGLKTLLYAFMGAVAVVIAAVTVVVMR